MRERPDAEVIADLQEQLTAALAEVAAVNELCDDQQRELELLRNQSGDRNYEC